MYGKLYLVDRLHMYQTFTYLLTYFPGYLLGTRVTGIETGTR